MMMRVRVEDVCFVFFFKQKTAYEMRISDWSSDVCSSDLCLSRLLVAGRTWIKLCGYRASQAGPPYADLQAPARALIESAPNRCVWGTDWPHPMLGNSPMPDDVNLLLALMSWEIGRAHV